MSQDVWHSFKKFTVYRRTGHGNWQWKHYNRCHWVSSERHRGTRYSVPQIMVLLHGFDAPSCAQDSLMPSLTFLLKSNGINSVWKSFSKRQSAWICSEYWLMAVCFPTPIWLLHFMFPDYNIWYKSKRLVKRK